MHSINYHKLYSKDGKQTDAERELEIIQTDIEILELKKRALEMKDKLTVDRTTYTGTEELYHEEEEEYDIRVKTALKDMVEQQSPIHIMCLQYLHFILSITGSFEMKNPTLMDIEAFEDFLEPFIVTVLHHDMKTFPELSKVMVTASQIVEDLLISDFIYSPYTKKDASSRFIMVSPEFNYATKNVLQIPQEYKIETDICVSDELIFGSAVMVIEDEQPPIVRLTLKPIESDGGQGTKEVNQLLRQVDIDTYELANIYLKTEMFPTQYEDYRLTDSITRLMMTNIIQAINNLGEVDNE